MSLTAELIAGKDVTDVFFQLHRTSVLDKPAYKRLIIGTIGGQLQQYQTPAAGTLSAIPYAVRFGRATWPAYSLLTSLGIRNLHG